MYSHATGKNFLWLGVFNKLVYDVRFMTYFSYETIYEEFC